ncbi:MAG: thioredoxin family protein [Candidatus Kapabacteria bacterium]|nr:thioredoxin family protein [Candidatus Kapabacteria bacterium]
MNRVFQWCVTVLIVVTTLSAIARANGNEGGVNVGDSAPVFSLMNVDGKKVALSDFSSAKGAIIVFTCNHCPYSVKYEDRIIALHQQFASQGYPVIAINPNDPVTVPEDAYDQMIVRAKEKKFPFPYLVDETQEIAKAYGAKRTPHVYVVANTKDGSKVAYIGSIDDNAADASAAESFFVSDAVTALLAGKLPTTPLTKAIGCTIKWKKK